MAAVPVPKAAMYKNDLLQPGKSQIRTAGQVIPVQPESVSQTVRKTAHPELSLGVAAAHGSHYPGAMLSRKSIDHLVSDVVLSQSKMQCFGQMRKHLASIRDLDDARSLLQDRGSCNRSDFLRACSRGCGGFDLRPSG
jgi:hypothetical protein